MSRLREICFGGGVVHCLGGRRQRRVPGGIGSGNAPVERPFRSLISVDYSTRLLTLLTIPAGVAVSVGSPGYIRNMLTYSINSSSSSATICAVNAHR